MEHPAFSNYFKHWSQLVFEWHCDLSYCCRFIPTWRAVCRSCVHINSLTFWTKWTYNLPPSLRRQIQTNMALSTDRTSCVWRHSYINLWFWRLFLKVAVIFSWNRHIASAVVIMLIWRIELRSSPDVLWGVMFQLLRELRLYHTLCPTLHLAT